MTKGVLEWEAIENESSQEIAEKTSEKQIYN